MAEVIVFAGPSLYEPKPGRSSLLPKGFQLRPPARRGDVIASLSENPRALVILDGYFHSLLSVSHKEILKALDDGIQVIGAASMGALRAAEMETFGMTGAGRVFEWYRDGVIDGDDEVAVLHLPEEQGCRPVTLALVELRWALDRIKQDGLAAPGRVSDLVSEVKSWSFDQRFPAEVLAAAARHLPDTAFEALRRSLATISLKRADCRAAFRIALRPWARTPAGSETATIFLTHLFEERAAPPRVSPRAAQPPSHARAWNAVQLLHPDAPRFAAAARKRFLLVSAGLQAGLHPDPELAGKFFERLLARLRCFGQRWPLPESEIREEAASRALAEQARRHFGSPKRAIQALAERMGLDPRFGPGELDSWLRTQSNLQPPWTMIRAFVFSPAYPAASAAAAAIEEIHDRFAGWAEGARPSLRDVSQQACALWACPPNRVEREAGRRGLLPSGGFSPGFREIVEWILPAERLRDPVNGYPELKRRLRTVRLGSRSAWPAVGSIRRPRRSVTRDRSEALRQYELPIAFWRTVLGPEMHFHMGHFPTPDTPLENAMRLAVDRLAGHIPKRPSAALLDIGGGWGGPAFQLVSSGAVGSALCLTHSSRQARHIRNLAARRGLPVRARVADVESFDFTGAGDCEVLWMFEILEHVSDRAGVLRRLNQACRSDAVLAVATTCAASSPPTPQAARLLGFENLQTPARLESLLVECGWSLLHREDVSPLLGPLWDHWRGRLAALEDSPWKDHAASLASAFTQTESLFSAGRLQAIQLTARPTPLLFKSRPMPHNTAPSDERGRK